MVGINLLTIFFLTTKENTMIKEINNENVLNKTLHEIMEVVDNNPNLNVDLVDNLYYALLSECKDNPDTIEGKYYETLEN